MIIEEEFILLLEMPAATNISTVSSAPLGERTVNNSNCHDAIITIFNSAQHVTSTDSSLTELKKLYRNTDYNEFILSFKHCLKNLLQSSPANKIFFNTACEFVCNFLEYITDIKSTAPSTDAPENDESVVAKQQQEKPTRRRSTRGGRTYNSKRNTNKRKQIPVDELCDGLSLMNESQPAALELYEVTNHDRLISAVVLDVINHYMQSVDDDCRCNAVMLITKVLSSVSSLDQGICDVIKTTLAKRMRDKKAIIRAHAILASKTFQDCKLIREAFIHHFERDPEPIVRKALIQVMDTKVFKHGFLIDSTRDSNEPIRKVAYHLLGLLNPLDLTLEDRHKVIHNGLNERCRHLAYVFRSRTLDLWTKTLYDRVDLIKLVQSFDVINNLEDMQRLVDLIYMEDLENIQTNGSTRLHSNVELLRQNLLNAQTRLPDLESLNDKSVFIWMTLLRFCKKNSGSIQPVRLVPHVDANTSIEKLIDTNTNVQEEEIDLYERLCPDLVTLADYIKKFVYHTHEMIERRDNKSVASLEFVYQQLMQFIETYEIVDELERKYTQEVFRLMLKENLLTGAFEDFITPIVRCLSRIIYKTSPNLMVSLVSDMINDVRSNLEDLTDRCRRLGNTQEIAKSSTPFKPRGSFPSSNALPLDVVIENEIAQNKVDLRDAEEKYQEEKDFDESVLKRIEDLRTNIKLLSDKRHSLIAFPDTGYNASSRSSAAHLQSIDFDTEDVQIFKHHRSELLKCLQMFAACFEYCDLKEVPVTMSTHLTLLSLEGMEWTNDPTIKSLVIRCTGLAALTGRNFALQAGTLALLVGGCKDPMIEVKTRSYRSLVDVVIQHREIEVQESELYNLFRGPLKKYGNYDPKDDKKSTLEYLLAITEGATKLFYFEKLSSPEILADLILWWYHPRTHSRVKQYIGVFLPIFVEDLTGRSRECEAKLHSLLEKTFLLGVESLHAYILGPGYNIMAASDILSMIRFMCSLIPVVCHVSIAISVARRIRELSRLETDSCNDLCGYLISAFTFFDIKKASSDSLDDLENALSELESIIDRLSNKSKQLKSQYTKFRHQVDIAERVPDQSSRKRTFDEFQSTMIEVPGDDAKHNESNKDEDTVKNIDASLQKVEEEEEVEEEDLMLDE